VVYQGSDADDYPFFKVSDMNNEGNDTFMVRSNNWISEKVQRELAAPVFPPDTIVFAKVGAAIFLERKRVLVRASCLDNNMMGYVVDPMRANTRFLSYWLQSVRLGDLAATTALPSLSRKQLAAMRLCLPSLQEQCKIAKILSDMDAEIAALERRRDKTKTIKQGMMQALLTGRIRLAKPEVVT
jgi:type I restriction enzyme S subunit